MRIAKTLNRFQLLKIPPIFLKSLLNLLQITLPYLISSLGLSVSFFVVVPGCQFADNSWIWFQVVDFFGKGLFVVLDAESGLGEIVVVYGAGLGVH